MARIILMTQENAEGIFYLQIAFGAKMLGFCVRGNIAVI